MKPSLLTRALHAVGLERRSSLSSPSEALLNAFGSVSRSGARVSEDTAWNVSVFSACANVLAQSIAMLPLKVYRKTATGADEAVDHPVSRLLRRKPGLVQTSYQWRSATMASVCVGGNGYSRVHRNGFFEVERIEPLRACEVAPVVLESGRLAYRVQQRAGSVLLQDFEVLHIRGLSSNGYTGRSPLHDLRDALGLALTAEEFTASTFANGNRQPGVIKGPAGWDAAKAMEFKKYWQDAYGGAGNAGRTPVFYGGVDWAGAGFTNQDAELLMSRRFQIEEVSRAFRVPLHLLNSTEKSTTWGSGIDQLNQGFVAYTLQPWVENWQQELEDKLLSEAEKAAGYFIKFNLGVLLRGAPEKRAAFYQIMRGIAAMDVNQIRALEDWNEYPDGWAGDPRQPLNTGASAPAAPAAQPAPAPDPAAQD